MDDLLVWLAVGIAGYWVARLVQRLLFEVRFSEAAFKGIDATSNAAEDYIGEDADWIVHLLSGLGAREETIRATVTQAATTMVMAPEHQGEYGRARDRLADKMTREQIAEAQKLARAWMVSFKRSGQ